MCIECKSLPEARSGIFQKQCVPGKFGGWGLGNLVGLNSDGLLGQPVTCSIIIGTGHCMSAIQLWGSCWVGMLALAPQLTGRRRKGNGCGSDQVSLPLQLAGYSICST